jgi:hypothetical protein
MGATKRGSREVHSALFASGLLFVWVDKSDPAELVLGGSR